MFRVYLYGGIALALGIAVFLGWTAIKTFGGDVAKLGEQIATLKHENELQKSKIAAYVRAQERRDNAIAASPCKNQIQFWMKNPEQIPGTWNPHEQLTAPNIRDNPKPGTLPNFDWSFLNPWKWF
jgi:hypothetical protein